MRVVIAAGHDLTQNEHSPRAGDADLTPQRRGRIGSAQNQAVAVRADVDRHHVAVVHVAGQQHLGELVADGLLDQPAQRTRPVERVEPTLGQPLLGGQRHLEGEPALASRFCS